ncbi:50S ribosomal protein L3 [Golovinomyces cichoracearum]|uniref:Large ribosomal subunit protein uL3c n=1 Tax=Golovinomyces cichoracearum TaxID=62708 RepID=A0A420HV42_9PEZI|nr:50S ribosomal protein L3 [Golovinomyces cichoracearum]
MVGLVGKKIGMTRIFTKEGTAIPVTVIELQENRITQIKNMNTDFYCAIQVTTGLKKTNKLKKPQAGHFLKSGVLPGRGLWEFRTSQDKIFKGFCGTVKRWNFRTQDATHGNSLSHRVPGSIGQNQTPGKVFKGKKMAGQLGNNRVTVQSLNVVNIDENKNILLVKGAVPGATGSNLIVKPAVKV